MRLCWYIAILLLLATHRGAFAIERGEAAQESLKSKRLIVAIGISRFEDEVWHDLRYATKDATDIHEYFSKREDPFEGGQLVTGDGSGVVTKAEALAALDRLAHANRNEDDTIILYISSHGTVGYRPDGSIGRYIITSDTSARRVAETAIEYDALMERFKRLPSRKKVLILAFCHSGVGKSALTPEMKKALARLKSPFFEEPIHDRSEGTIVLTASGWREPALEDEWLQNDVYTHYLLKGFSKDRNGDGAVTITEAHDFASQATYEHTGGRQRPSAILELLGADPIFVSGKPRSGGKAMIYAMMSRFSRMLVEVDGQEKGTLEKGVLVDAGKARVVLRDPDTKKVVATRVMVFDAGREYAAADLLLPRFPNHLFVGPVVSRFLGVEERAGYFPQDSRGGSLRYRRDEGLGFFDVGFELKVFADQEETIEAEGRPFEQTRESASMRLTLGGRNRMPGLSSPNAPVELHWRAGPECLRLVRRGSDPALALSGAPDYRLGAGVGSGLSVTWPYYLLHLDFGLDVSTYPGLIAGSSRSPTSLSATVSAGTFW